MTKTALVLGATGGIGGEMARGLLARCYEVTAMTRDPARMGLTRDIHWVAGDALRPADVQRAAVGAEVIVHAVNPPGYRNWAGTVLPMIDNTIAAAARTGARIVLPGTVYNFGPDVFPLIGEDAPQNPLTRKGRIRVALERRLEAAAAQGSIRALIVRAGDYFGPGAGNTWFGQGVVKPGRRPTAITEPGRPGIGHQWAYLPDVAETMLRLLEQSALPGFARYHMGGHWDADGHGLTAAIRRVLDAPQLPVKRFPWWLVRLASPVVPIFRELSEMRYLWQQPVRLDNRRLVALLGAEPHTPLDEAIAATLHGLKCL